MIDSTSWVGAGPEILLLVMACVVTLADLAVKTPRRTGTYVLTLATLAVVALMQFNYALAGETVPLFGGMVVSDPLGHWLKGFAAVAVLVTPIAVALAQSLGVSARPFLVAVMMAASAAFATPFGYQTNVLVYQVGGYSYTDFVKIGVPLNLLTWLVGVLVIPVFFPF